jgi:hypothetical protein
MSQGANIFFLYDPEDKVFFEDIRKHLGRAVRKMNTFWTPESPAPGADTTAQWKQYLEGADLVVLLASADYWNSEICDAIHDEVLERFEQEQLALVPVLVRDHLWRDELPDIQVLPKDERPIHSFPDDQQDSVLKDIASEIKKLIEKAGARQDLHSQMELLTRSLFYFNYQEQKETVYDYYHQLGDRFNPLNIFLVRGTERCGHHLLINILRKEYRIGLESPPLPIPLDLVGRTVDALWYELRNALHLRELDPYDKEGIAGRILARLEYENITLLFEHIERCHRQEILPVINGFWYELNGYLERLNPERTPHRFFLFINDRACGQFEYKLEQFYPESLDALPAKVVQLLPSIKRVKRNDVDMWLSKIFDAGLDYRELWTALKDKSGEIVEAPDGHYVKDAVTRIIDRLPVKDRKAEILAQLKL